MSDSPWYRSCSHPEHFRIQAPKLGDAAFCVNCRLLITEEERSHSKHVNLRSDVTSFSWATLEFDGRKFLNPFPKATFAELHA